MNAVSKLGYVMFYRNSMTSMSSGLQNGNMMQDAACGWPVFWALSSFACVGVIVPWQETPNSAGIGALVMLILYATPKSSKIQWLIMMFPQKTCHVHPWTMGDHPCSDTPRDLSPCWIWEQIQCSSRHVAGIPRFDTSVWSSGSAIRFPQVFPMFFFPYMGMDQYLLIPFLGGWTSIYQLFWCSPGVQGFDTLPYNIMFNWWFHLFCISNFHMFVHCLFLYIFIMSLFFHKFFQSGGPSGPSGQGLSLVISLLQKLPSLAEVVNQVRSR